MLGVSPACSVRLNIGFSAFGKRPATCLLQRLLLILRVARFYRVYPLGKQRTGLCGLLTGQLQRDMRAQPHFPGFASKHVTEHPRFAAAPRYLQVQPAAIRVVSWVGALFEP